MSNRSIVASDPGPGLAAEVERQAVLRLAVGVTACFALVEALNWDATFLAPMLAANMLVKPRPPTFAQGVVVVVLFVLSTGVVLAVTNAFISNVAVLVLGLMLLLYLSFYAHRRGAPDVATLLPQISAVSLPIVAVLSPEGAGAFAITLVLAGSVAILTVWAAHAAFPVPVTAPLSVPETSMGTVPDQPAAAARLALLDTLVLVPVLAWFILDASQVAVVVLIVIVTLLRQTSRQKGQGAAVGLILGNLIGGVAAAFAYNLVLLGNTLLFFITVCLAASLMFAARISTAGARAPVYVVALGTFILLLGLGLSPLPGSSGEAFISRLLNVIAASAYAIGALSLVERWR